MQQLPACAIIGIRAEAGCRTGRASATMKVLLINPPDSAEAMLGAGRHLVPKYEPLGLLYLAAVLRQGGFEPEIIDARAEGCGLEALKERVLRRAPGLVGISTLTCSGANVLDLGRWLKKKLPGTLVVLGNVHASVYAEQYLRQGCCDIVVHGEGEQAMLEIAAARRAGRGPEGIAGISFAAAGGVTRTPDRTAPQDLEELPLPARDLLDRSRYGLGELSNQAFIGGGGGAAMTMSTSRGCPYGCSFCAARGKDAPRRNSAQRVLAEMELLEKEYGASYLTIVDPFFLGDRGRVLEICAGRKARGLKARWGCDAHVNCVDKELTAALDGAGCYELSFGIESGVQRLLDAVNKTTTVAQVRRTVEMVKGNSRMYVSGLFILGLPGETYEEALETIRFARSLPLDMAQFSMLIPYPGSALYAELSKDGELDTGVRADGSLDASVWERYSSYLSFTGKDPVWVTPSLSAAQLKSLQKRAQREFYLRPAQIARNVRRLRLRNLPAALNIILKGFF